MTISDRVRVKNVEILSDRRYRLNEVEFDYRRGNGEWQTQKREVFDRGHAATLLPYNLAKRTVVLARQFRLPAYLAGHDDLMIEAAAGMAKLQLLVRRENTGVAAFYQSIGFEEAQTIMLAKWLDGREPPR